MTAPLSALGPSPDLPAAVDLTLHQVNETDLVDAAVGSIKVRIPEWNPTEGATEVLLIEALALLIGQDVYALNRLPRVVLDGLLQLSGLRRSTPTQASGTVTVTVVSTASGTVSIPAGALFRVTPDNSDAFDVQAAGAVSRATSDGYTFAVPVTAVLPGSRPTGVPAGTPVALVDYYSFVESSALTTGFTGGTDAEPDALFYPRAVAYLSRPRSLVLAPHFTVAALEVPGCGRAQSFNRWDGSGSAVGTVNGHVSVAAATPAGGALAAGVKAAVQQHLLDGALANLTVHVLDPRVVPVTITCSVSVVPGYSPAAVTAAVRTAIAAAVDPATRPWGSVIYANEVVGIAARVAGVNLVQAVGGASVGAAATVLDLPAANPTITVTAV